MTHIKNVEFLTAFRECLYSQMSIDVFEKTWAEAVVNSGLCGNAWVEATYASRHSWAEAYVRGNFWGFMRTTQRCESIHSQVKKFVQQGFRLYQFIEGVNKAVESLRHQETIAEYESRHKQPPLVTVLRRIESHAAKVFTRASFNKIQEQIRAEALWYVINKTSGTGFRQYTVRQYGDETKLQHVTLKMHDPSIQCSCMEFETNGLPCCHAIHVAKVEELIEIPFNLIMNRWTKRARELHNQGACTPHVEGTVMDWKARYGALSIACNQLCYWASQTPECYNEVMSEVEQLTVKVEGVHVSDDVSNDDTKVVGRIGDPIKPKRHAQVPKRRKHASGPRKCSNCHGTGHTRKTCPNICPDIKIANSTTISKQEPSNCERNLSVIYEEGTEHTDEDTQAFISEDNFFFSGEGSQWMIGHSGYGDTSTPTRNAHLKNPHDASSRNW